MTKFLFPFNILLISLLSCSSAFADTVALKDGRDLKGLIVEDYDDRIILSTVDGEKIILRQDIEEIQIDDPAYNFLSLGRAMEREKKYYAALSYFDRAYQLNPQLEEAKTAAVSVRSRLMAKSLNESHHEIDKRQDLQDAWRASITLDEQVGQKMRSDNDMIWMRLGIKFEMLGDWASISDVRLGSDAHSKGIRRGDLIYAVDGRSLRFLNPQAVAQIFLEPRFSPFALKIVREFVFPQSEGFDPQMLGFELEQHPDGIVVSEVKEKSASKKKGLKAGDRLLEINGIQTRYITHRKAIRLMKDGKELPLVLKIIRHMQIARK